MLLCRMYSANIPRVVLLDRAAKSSRLTQQPGKGLARRWSAIVHHRAGRLHVVPSRISIRFIVPVDRHSAMGNLELAMRRRDGLLCMMTLAAFAVCAGVVLAQNPLIPDDPATAPSRLELPVTWEYGPPLITPDERADGPRYIHKDPSVVFHNGAWHVFMTVKMEGMSATEYCRFDRWENADKAPRTILRISDSKYYCAPQVFYFTPHKKWYLIYQVGVSGAKKMWVAYSTTDDIADPASWTKARPILDGGENDPRQEGGLDYWIICDEQRAYLFLTSLNGKMWRLWTKLEDFPNGFGHCELALRAEIFEASHTYKLKGMNKYLTIVEQDGRRYYKAYIADRLDGRWTPLADTADRPFAGWKNIGPSAGVEAWTDNISHGELIRDGCDQTLTVDPNNLRLIFQGMLGADKAGKGYGRFAWRIGMLTPVSGQGRPRH